ncbi:DUF2690 domain-containing protein [Amycolatopsis coloradensis]|uniref:DUF2690 domain-containing protein n=1 Tax=Amycolatopsis coloradensis TaxID=76021 RepID=UPI00117843E3|nr:DUF2690 domain-containing protein [Amycolatopsis coloradensis]
MGTDEGTPETVDSTEVFVEDLRRLRQSHGEPTWTAMARRASNRGAKASHGTLHNAVTTGRLPSELAVTAFVMALTNDRAQVARWLTRRAALVDTASGAEFDGASPVPVEKEAGFWRRRRRIVACVAAVLLSNTVTGLVVFQVARRDQPPTPIVTGEDPARTTCVDDAKIAAASDRNPAFLLEILFSSKCQAGWARATRRDQDGVGNTIDVVIYRRSEPDGGSRQSATEPDVQSAYTTLIVRTDPADRLCATGAITTDHARQVSPEPICT